MVRGNIAATSLKMLWENLYSVKCFDKLNMNVFTLSKCENFWWGFIYFDQFSSNYHQRRQLCQIQLFSLAINEKQKTMRGAYIKRVRYITLFSQSFLHYHNARFLLVCRVLCAILFNTQLISEGSREPA